MRREVGYGSGAAKSRVDFLLTRPSEPSQPPASGPGTTAASSTLIGAARHVYVEVKSVTLAEDDVSTGERVALFPDTVCSFVG